MTRNCWKDISSMELRASIEDKKRIQDLKKSVNRFGDILRFFMHGGMELLVEKMYQARKCSFCFVHVLHETTLYLEAALKGKNNSH